MAAFVRSVFGVGRGDATPSFFGSTEDCTAGWRAARHVKSARDGKSISTRVFHSHG